MDVLTRGPVHEAFAEQYNTDPVEGLVVPKAPPDPVNEVPPETMPEGNNVQWIPGYWGWDDERKDFIWISGLWRDVPPGQRWVPGYWNPTGNGYQWVPGFWTAADSAELEYRSQPPSSLEQGPNIEAPSDSHFWVPGCWMYSDASYRWRPGYWAPAYDEWVWIPDRWVWSPYGYVFCPGYWDYRLPVRGVLFAPVYFTHVHWWHTHPFVPGCVLDVGPLTLHWFVRPSYCHYYFGDFYADYYYTGWGLQPWYTCHFGFGGFHGWRGRFCHYDPLLVFYTGYHHRHHGIDFRGRLGRWHKHYHDHEHDRPRRTFRDQERFLAQRDRGDGDRGRHQRLGRDLDDFVRRPGDGDHKFVKLDGRQRDRHTKIAKDTVELAHLRKNTEGVSSIPDARRGRNGQESDRGNRRRAGGPGSSDEFQRPEIAGDAAAGEGGRGGRRERKLKLPQEQGAGDQVTPGGGGDSGRRSRRINAPDGPPSGSVVAEAPRARGDRSMRQRSQGDGDGQSGRGRGRGRGDSTGDVSPRNLTPDGNPDQSGNRRRGGRRQEGGSFQPRSQEFPSAGGNQDGDGRRGSNRGSNSLQGGGHQGGGAGVERRRGSDRGSFPGSGSGPAFEPRSLEGGRQRNGGGQRRGGGGFEFAPSPRQGNFGGEARGNRGGNWRGSNSGFSGGQFRSGGSGRSGSFHGSGGGASFSGGGSGSRRSGGMSSGGGRGGFSGSRRGGHGGGHGGRHH